MGTARPQGTARRPHCLLPVGFVGERTILDLREAPAHPSDLLSHLVRNLPWSLAGEAGKEN